MNIYHRNPGNLFWNWARWTCLLFIAALPVSAATIQVAKEIAIDTSALPRDFIAPRLVPGDLLGDGKLDWVFFHGSRFIRAYSHDGDLLWSEINSGGVGNKAPWHPWVSAVWDLDGDGRSEVITVLQRSGSGTPYLTVLDGETGDLISEKELWFTPSSQGNHSRRALISIAYLNGPDEPCIIVGADDVLHQARAYDKDLNLLWTHESGAISGSNWWIPGDGHFIWPHDLNNDGKEEVFIGKRLYDGQGNLIHNLLGDLNDHVDSLVCGDFHPEYEGMEVVYCGAFGLAMININPDTFAITEIWEMAPGNPIRNPQTINANRYNAAYPGQQILVAERGSEPNRQFYMLTYEGEVIGNMPATVLVMPSDLDGDRNEVDIMTDRGLVVDKSGSTVAGTSWYTPMEGVLNYSLSMDVLGDPREEILVWNRNKLVIGTNVSPLDEEIPSLRNQREYLRGYSANRYMNRGYRFYDYSASMESLEMTRPAHENAVLYEDQETVSTRGSLFVGRTPDPDSVARRSLLRFDLSGFPSQANFIGASVQLIYSEMGPVGEEADLPVAFHRLVRPWQEGESASGSATAGQAASNGDPTWLHSEYPGQFWTLPGGDYIDDPSATLLISADLPRSSAVQLGTPRLLSDLRHWIANPEDNHGWILIGDESQAGTGLEFRGRHGRSPASRPTLVIQYRFEDFPKWGNLEAVNATGDVEDAGRLGWINIHDAPWIYVYSLQAWVYAPDPDSDWFFVVRPD